MSCDALTISKRFALEGEPVDAKPYGCGHINDTYCVCCRREGESPAAVYPPAGEQKRVCQCARADGYYDPCHRLSEGTRPRRGRRSRPGMPPARPHKGRRAVSAGRGGPILALFRFHRERRHFQTVGKPEHFYYSACAFGKFQRLLAAYPAETLHEVIPHFHDTADRYKNFEKAVAENASGRAADVEPEIAFVRAREADTHRLVDLLAAGELPLRVTHNDTKLNNVMLDDVTGRPVAVIDLDTVMPGLSLYDFGDSIRFGANPAAEDEQDLSKVYCDLNLFEEYTKGFLEECGDMLTAREIELLPFAAKIMTFECGIRFLTDHIAGDTYFKIHREGHNLDRCRTQFKLVADMEAKMEQMKAIVAKYAPCGKITKRRGSSKKVVKI